MKTMILNTVIAATMILALPANADKAPWLALGDPTMMLKYGGWANMDDEAAPGRTRTITLSFETRACRQYVLCYNPFFIAAENDTGVNAGLGADVVYRMAENKKGDSLFVAGGVAAFQDRLNSDAGERTNYHFELGVELQDVVLSYQVFVHVGSRDDSSPVDMQLLTVGYHFR